MNRRLFQVTFRKLTVQVIDLLLSSYDSTTEMKEIVFFFFFVFFFDELINVTASGINLSDQLEYLCCISRWTCRSFNNLHDFER